MEYTNILMPPQIHVCRIDCIKLLCKYQPIQKKHDGFVSKPSCLFGAGGGTPRPKSRRKRRLASEWRLRAHISPNVGSRPPWQQKRAAQAALFVWCRRWDCRRAACVRPCQSGCADACLLGVSRISPGEFSSSPHSKKAQHPQGVLCFLVPAVGLEPT